MDFCDCFVFCINDIKCFDDGCRCMSSKYLPKMRRSSALLLCVINCIPITPGIGTIISASVAEKGVRCYIVLIGVFQFLLTPVLLLGYIWSIVHGIRLYRLSAKTKINMLPHQSTPSDI